MLPEAETTKLASNVGRSSYSYPEALSRLSSKYRINLTLDRFSDQKKRGYPGIATMATRMAKI